MAVTDEAITRIRSLIIEGRIGPGDRLPHENRLADELGISRNSTREAVRALEQARVLEVRQGSGTYVTSLEPATLLGNLANAVDLLRGDTLLEVLDVRQMLEPAATARAASAMTPERLAAIRDALDSVSPDASVAELAEADIRFHSAVAAATGNATLGAILDGLSSRGAQVRIWERITAAGATARTIAAHNEIYHALRQGDQHLAQATSLVHLRDAGTWLRAALDERRVAPRPRPAGRPPVTAIAEEH